MTRVDRFEEIWERIEAGAALPDAARGEALDPSTAEELSVAAALRQAGREMESPDPDRMWGAIAAQIDLESEPKETRSVSRLPGRVRTMALMVAAVMLLGGAALLAARGNGGGSPADGPAAGAGRGADSSATAATIDRAETLLADLALAARTPGEDVLDLARELARLRREVLDGGGDVSSLDRLIRRTLAKVVPSLPPGLARDLRGLLGGLVPEPRVTAQPTTDPGEPPQDSENPISPERRPRCRRPACPRCRRSPYRRAASSAGCSG